MTTVTIYNNSHSECEMPCNRLLAALLSAMVAIGLVPSGASAQSLPQPSGYDSFVVTAPAEPRPYEFAILGVKPGMPIEEALALIENHLGKELASVEGTLQITSSDGRAFKTQLRIGYETPGIDFFLRNQSVEHFDSIEIDVSTPASGSVVTAIRREVRMSASDGSDAASLLAQLAGLHGTPSETDEAPGQLTWLWAQDLTYTAIGPVGGGNVPEYACVFGMPENGQYSYEPPFLSNGPNNCGVTYRVSHRSNGDTVTLRFWLTDYNLVDQDREAANAQIDEKLNAKPQASDIKL